MGRHACVCACVRARLMVFGLGGRHSALLDVVEHICGPSTGPRRRQDVQEFKETIKRGSTG